MNIIGIIVGAAIALGLLMSLMYMNKDGKAACVNAGCASCSMKNQCRNPDVYAQFKAENEAQTAENEA